MTNPVGAPNSIMRKFHDLPEPSAMQREYSPCKITPWGTAQSARRYGNGVIFYSTASHGGFHLSASALRRVPAYLQQADLYADGTLGWYEEDCASAIVIVCLPELFPLEHRLNAAATMQRTYPGPWEQFCIEFASY